MFTTNFIVVIPARFASSRLPGKPLLDITGKPMIQWVYEQATASAAKAVYVATDDQRIADCVQGFGGECVMTDSSHQSGTERIAQLVQELELSDMQIIVNVQGDEPDMPSALIQQMADGFAVNGGQQADIVTSCAPLDDFSQLQDPNCVKVVRDAQQRALYFSRAPIAYNRAPNDFASTTYAYRRHIGIYAYRAAYITQFAQQVPCELELTEGLEQLRALWHGGLIFCPDACAAPGPGIDTEADIEQARIAFNAKEADEQQ